MDPSPRFVALDRRAAMVAQGREPVVSRDDRIEHGLVTQQ